jgi:dihydrofolate reductase
LAVTSRRAARPWPPGARRTAPSSSSWRTVARMLWALYDADATWAPATVLRGDVPAEVTELKRQPGRELQIHGSTTLGRSLMAAGLVDELRLVIAPVVAGAGRRLFERSDQAVGLGLVDATTTGPGLAVHAYTVTGPASFDTYDPAAHSVSGHLA